MLSEMSFCLLCSYIQLVGFLGRIVCTACKDTASCYRGSVVCLCVCLLVTTVIPTKMAEPTERPFGAWTRMGIRNRVLGAGPDPPKSKRQFFLGGGALPCDAAFRQNSITTCYLSILPAKLAERLNITLRLESPYRACSWVQSCRSEASSPRASCHHC